MFEEFFFQNQHCNLFQPVRPHLTRTVGSKSWHWFCWSLCLMWMRRSIIVCVLLSWIDNTQFFQYVGIFSSHLNLSMFFWNFCCFLAFCGSFWLFWAFCGCFWLVVAFCGFFGLFVAFGGDQARNVAPFELICTCIHLRTILEHSFNVMDWRSSLTMSALKSGFFSGCFYGWKAKKPKTAPPATQTHPPEFHRPKAGENFFLHRVPPMLIFYWVAPEGCNSEKTQGSPLC